MEILYFVGPLIAFVVVTALLNKAEQRLEARATDGNAKKKAADRAVDAEQAVTRARERRGERGLVAVPAAAALIDEGKPLDLKSLVPPEFEMREFAGHLVDQQTPATL